MKSVFAWVMSLMVGLSVLPAQAVAVASKGEKGKILVVMTNHERYPSRSDTTGLWLTELTHFMDTVEAAGYTTVFTSPKGGKVPLDERSLKWLYTDEPARQHLKSPRFLARLKMTTPAASIDPSGFSAIYFTGGHGVMWDFPENKELQRLAESIYAKGGVVAVSGKVGAVAAVPVAPAAAALAGHQAGWPLRGLRPVTVPPLRYQVPG